MSAALALTEPAAEARAVPANIEAEAALLGALLIENTLFDAIADVVAASDFFEPLHERIYAAALQEVMTGRTASPVTLQVHFRDDPAIAELGGVSYLARLTADGQGLLAPLDLARQVRELSRRRAMLGQLVEAVQACFDMGTGLATIADMASAIGVDTVDRGMVEASLGECVEAHIRSLSDGTAGVTTGGRIHSLDDVLGAIRAKHFVLLAARPGMGKSATALSYAIGAAQAGHGVLFVSIEMSGEDIGGRAAADACFGLAGNERVPYAAIADGHLNPTDRERVSRASSRLHRLPLVLIDTPTLTPGRLSRLVKRQARRFAARGTPLSLVMVDYLQRMKPDRERSKKYEEVGEISRAFKDIAKEHSIAVMALAQLSREVERRADKRPILADLRDSGELEQDADSVVFLYRPDYYLAQARPSREDAKFPAWEAEMDAARGQIEFIVAKRRGGPTGAAFGTFHDAYQAVRG